MKRSPHGRAARQRGFTLLEVLIALLVLAFGLLGFALLQTMNLRFTQGANYRTQAANLAYDLLDQVRANRLQARDYTEIIPGDFAAETGENCAKTGELTVEDSMDRWRCQVVATLGKGATAVVNFDEATQQIAVRITWDDTRWIADDENHNFDLRTEL